jgi:transcriptional regulator with XRE-family HTH domain
MAERHPLSEDHRLLGELLRAAREQAGVTTRDVSVRTSGHVSNVENGHATPSREFVEHYITHFGCDRRHALHLYEKVSRWGAEQRRKGRVTPSHPARQEPYLVTEYSPFEEIRRGYRNHEVEAYYRLDEKGVIREVNVIRWVSALYSGVDLVSARFWYTADQRRVLSIQAGSGCSVVNVLETEAGYLAAVLRLSSVLSPEDRSAHAFSFRILNVSDIPARPMLRYYLRSTLSRYALRVQFDPDVQPEGVWYFRDNDSSISAFYPQAEQFLPLSESGYFFADFHDVNEEHVGISWKWPDRGRRTE